jgi:hypothetical protein
MKPIRRSGRAVASAIAGIAIVLLSASPAYAAADPGTAQLKTILNNATSWLVGILATVATLFLTLGGIRYLMAGGDPGEVEKAKGSVRSAIIGYALAALAPIVVTIVKSILGVH